MQSGRKSCRVNLTVLLSFEDTLPLREINHANICVCGFLFSALQEQTARDITSRLQVAQTFLKTDFKIHESRADPCADHCTVYAGSSDELEYQGYCEHQYNVICDRCENYRNALVDLQLSLSASAVKYR